eukprot:NODE_458_length_3028_cov_12.264736.p1 GENE.NODE_458_length_3028_cov_12.264736~~NODE_458_length_3028_cov_12.264736.p1  ORF type:complete len:743 (+),score=139.82 NODE_458_length_3028_cov_12.264736:195-2231(+)
MPKLSEVLVADDSNMSAMPVEVPELEYQVLEAGGGKSVQLAGQPGLIVAAAALNSSDSFVHLAEKPAEVSATSLLTSEVWGGPTEVTYKVNEVWVLEICADMHIYLDAKLTGAVTDKRAEPETCVSGVSEAEGFRCIISPNSTHRLMWDVAGLCLICFDLIVIPFNQAFSPPANWFSTGMDWVTLVFWTLDMCQGFFLGYFQKGEYINTNLKVLRHYLTSWFIVDCIVVIPDWVTKILDDADNEAYGDIGKIVKGARAVRAIRLLRLLKLRRLVHTMYDMIESEHTFIFVNLLKLLGSVLVLNHLIACLWYLLGSYGVNEDLSNWISHSSLSQRSLPFKYTTSLHWSLTQFTPAGMDVNARNTLERIFSIVVLFFAMVAFSSIVGGITAGMTSLRNLKQDNTKQLWLLRRYMRQRMVPQDLAGRIYSLLEHKTDTATNFVQEEQIKGVLSQLSVALTNELKYHNRATSLVTHPLFAHFDRCMVAVMHRLCKVALCIEAYGDHEGIFAGGDKAKKVYFLRPPATVCINAHSHEVVAGYNPLGCDFLEPPPRQGEAIGEAALWTTWRHQGNFFALSPCEVISIEGGIFSDVLSTHPRPWYIASSYAALFIELLNTRPVHDVVRDEDFSMAVDKFFVDTEQMIKPARNNLSQATAHALADKVQDGKDFLTRCASAGSSNWG